jgi:hypothetical protein
MKKRPRRTRILTALLSSASQTPFAAKAEALFAYWLPCDQFSPTSARILTIIGNKDGVLSRFKQE